MGLQGSGGTAGSPCGRGGTALRLGRRSPVGPGAGRGAPDSTGTEAATVATASSPAEFARLLAVVWGPGAGLGAAGSPVCRAGVGRGGPRWGWAPAWVWPGLTHLSSSAWRGQSDCVSQFFRNCRGSPPFLGTCKAPLNLFQATGFQWGTWLKSCVKQKKREKRTKAGGRYAFGVSVSHSWGPP